MTLPNLNRIEQRAERQWAMAIQHQLVEQFILLGWASATSSDNQLVKGKVPLTEEAASRLAQALGTSAGFRLTREARYRERLVRLESAGRHARGHPGSMSCRSGN